MVVHLVDGTFELFRCWFGSPKATAGGREIGAVRGLLRTLHGLVETEGATHVAIAFDRVIESFRNDLFPGYKTGDGVDPALMAQFPLAERAARAMGFVVWPMVRFEADDAIASGAAVYGADPRVTQVRLCTPDKDLAQCVRGARVVLVDRMRGTSLDAAGVEEKYGVAPASIPDWLALVGDDADGIPGLPRWGARSAAAVLKRYGHLEQIPDDPSAWDVTVRGAAALAESLRQHRGEALLYRTLATLCTDVPVEADVSSLAWAGARRDELASFCAELGFERFLERVTRFVPEPG